MIKTHAEVAVKWPKEFKIPLDPVQPESTLRINPSTSFPPTYSWDLSHSLSPPVTLHDLGPVASQLPSSLSPSFQLPTHQHAATKCPRSFWMSMPFKEREQKGEAVVIDEDTVHAADRHGNEDAKAA